MSYKFKLYNVICYTYIFQYAYNYVVVQLLSLFDSLRPYGRRLPCPSHLPELAQTLSIESVMPSDHLILCHPLLLPSSIFPSHF